MPVENNLSSFRRKRGLAAAEVAQAVGVSRQTIYAIEAGSYIPNTLVALRLARLLEVRVEEIFQLETETAPEPELLEARVLPGDEASTGTLVQLCKVDDQLIAVRPSLTQWTLPPADAKLIPTKEGRLQPGITIASSFRESHEYNKRLLIAGCDPAISIVARYVQKEGIDVVVVSRNSSQSLELLKQGLIHVAGTHLSEMETSKKQTVIQSLFGKGEVAVFSYAMWEQGLLVKPGNPKSIASVQDLARKGVRFINREIGAGNRILLDGQMNTLGLQPAQIAGYHTIVTSHLAAASAVQSDEADCCIATRVAAQLYGLDFVPLVRERYDFVVRSQHLELPAVQALLETLGRAALRRELNEFGGYDTSIAGERLE